MRNRLVLAATAGVCVGNALYLDRIPAWRQLLFVVLAGAAFLHGRWLPERRDWLVLAAAAVAGSAFLPAGGWRGADALLGLALFVVLPWLAGRFRRQQADLVLAGRDRIAQLERQQELVGEQARLRERARIAADMHDSLGHDLALIALRAGALELAADLSEPNRAAAAALRSSAVTATDRLRRTVGLLHDAGHHPTAPPEESIDALVDRAKAAGMDVALHREGEPEPLPTLVDRAAHRVVQESLTNAARHAPGVGVVVHLRQAADELVVTVRNGRPDTPAGPRSGPGSGLAGLRERVRLLGGTVRSGPRDGGFAVTARIPYGHPGREAGR